MSSTVIFIKESKKKVIKIKNNKKMFKKAKPKCYLNQKIKC